MRLTHEIDNGKPRSIGLRPPGDYPILLRMGHRFETSVGQRLIVDGLYGALDMAVDDEGWMCVINKHVTPNFARPFQRRIN